MGRDVPFQNGVPFQNSSEHIYASDNTKICAIPVEFARAGLLNPTGDLHTSAYDGKGERRVGIQRWDKNRVNKSGCQIRPAVCDSIHILELLRSCPIDMH